MRALIAAVMVVVLLAGCSSTAAARSSEPMPAAMVVYVVGDSITDGRYSPDWWRDGYAKKLSERICGMFCGGQLVTVGHGGGCLVAPGCGYPVPAVQWMFSEVFDAVPAPTTVIMEIGLNDLLTATDQQMLDAYAQLFFAAAARGIVLITATIPPTCSNRPGWAAGEVHRAAVNAWIRAYVQPVADVDAVLRAGNGALNPAYAQNRCLAGSDLIHPWYPGTDRMAGMVPLDRIR